jgi:hypothetical protein
MSTNENAEEAEESPAESLSVVESSCMNNKPSMNIDTYYLRGQ